MLDATFFIAVIAATIVSFVLGGIWYASPVFGRAWMAALGKTDADKEAMRKRAPIGFAAGLIMNLIAAIILGVLLSYSRDPSVGLPAGAAGGVIIGFLVWFGFILTTSVAGALFEGRPGKLVAINQSYSVVSYVLMGAILGIWL